MDQSLSLSHQSTPAAPGSSPPAAAAPAAALDEDPESPGRSPRPAPGSGGANDPLAEGIAMLGGVLLALLTVLVPFAAVITESQPGEAGQAERAGR